MKDRIADIVIFLCIVALVVYAALRGPNGEYAKVIWKILWEEGLTAAVQRYKDDHRPPLPPDHPSLVAEMRKADTPKFLELINSLREHVGVGELTLDEELCEIATYRASIMARIENITHELPNEGGPADTLAKFDYKWSVLAENMGGYGLEEQPLDIHLRFQQSPGHYKSMVNPKVSKLGIGIDISKNGRKYVCELFIAP